MKTNQVMKRQFMDSEILQRTKDGFFFATSLLDVYNLNSQSQKRFKDFWENKGTKDFIQELENEIVLNRENVAHLKTHETTRGRYGGGTWMHPYLFMKFAMWLSPKFELQVIKWVYDNLIDVRIEAGSHYKEMTKALMEYHERNPNETKSPLMYQEEANMINLLTYRTRQKDKRNELSESELKLMNFLQKVNIGLINQDKPFHERRKYLFDNLNLMKQGLNL